jgi:hypothetical protein
LRLSNSDRLLLVWLYRLFPSILSVIRIVRPETVIAGAVAAFEPTGGGNLAPVPAGHRSTARFVT